ncbi:hypothetical protein WR25_07065 isoform B [Diploscapter pachys]|uniref:Cadherin domain-containing protein n=1 Tax=Diploscapter pachys TaxID=2018661 RepID=A0A2A2L8J3_9BILA|nr:hypothetical protein WR25_07065 isoform B [Diploscapter pachys]
MTGQPHLPLLSFFIPLLLYSLPTSLAYLQNSDAVVPAPSNHPPVLQVSSTEGYLPETADIGTTVRISPNANSESLQILVNDDDLKPGMPPATYQYILTGLGATIFAVDQRGFVYLNVPNIDADGQNPSTYQLNVQAREVDTNPIRSSEPITITIHILDANDNSPEFEQSIYTANTTAHGGVRPIVKIAATDFDSGAYGQIEYEIAQVTNNAQDKFSYDKETNMLMATGDLVPGDRYQVVINAKDGGGRSSQAIAIVLATDPSLTSFSSLAPLPGMETYQTFLPNPSAVTPKMTLSTSNEVEETIQTFVTEVNENSPPNTAIVTLGGDESSEANYFNIVGGNEEGKFSIDDVGTIRTADSLDREKTAMYSLQVETRSRSPDQHLYWTLVQISVQDVNDNAPQFIGTNRLRLSIDDIEELSPNMVIGKVSVEDLDTEDNGRLELQIMPPGNRLFTISNEGIVSINGDFTADHFGEHEITVVARDHGDPPKEAQQKVVISVFGTLITVATQAPTNEIFEYTTSVEEEPHMKPTVNGNKIDASPSTFSAFPSTTSIMPEFTPVQLPINKGNSGGEIEEDGDDLEEEFTTVAMTSQPKSGSAEIYSPTRRPMTTSAFIYSPSTTMPYSPRTTHRVTATTPQPSTSQMSTDMETTEFVTTSASTTSLQTEPESTQTQAFFKPPQVTVEVPENSVEENMEIAKVHAEYIDGSQGSVTYYLQKGDTTLFEVASHTGSVKLLRPLDAETDTSYSIQISTHEAASMNIDPSLAHYATVTINIRDVNDWIPNFAEPSYTFPVREDTIPGTIVGSVSAYDQDRDAPNNLVRYSLRSAGGLEKHFAVNEQNGLITLAKPIDEFAGEKISLKIEATDAGEPPHSTTTTVLVDVVPITSQVIPNGNPMSNLPAEGQLQFSLRNYTASVSESVRPPHLVQVLSVNNKPADTRFIICTIVSGNYRGAFGVTAGSDGNCELRTQMELDREGVERYLLNITVTAGAQTDFALVSVTVLDVNDNVPRFIYDNDLGLSLYFAGVSSTASAFTRVLSVKAEDADLGNSSVVSYALDPLSAHWQYFSINPFGEISTKQSISQVLIKNRLSYFDIRVSACDSPVSGQQLCSKADVIINVISEAHRFTMATAGLNAQQLRAHEKDMVRSLRQFTGGCNLLNIEKMIEHSSSEGQYRTDIQWYAVNPSTKKVCKKHEFKKLFEPSSVAMIAGKVQPWFKVERLQEEVADEDATIKGGALLPANWKTASILLILLAITIAIGAIIAVCAVCVFWSRYKVEK